MSAAAPSTVFLVDDEPALLIALQAALEGQNLRTVTWSSAATALAQIENADVVVTDLVMPGMDGLALLAEVRKQAPDVPVIVLTARGSERLAVAVIKQGAYDYLPKPFGVEELRTAVTRAVETRRLRRLAQDLQVERVLGRPVVGESLVWKRLVADAERVARRDVPVLLRGETGTGKEVVAGMIHAHSVRRTGPLVRFNAAAIPADVAESELFGHAKGAFTGAVAARRGFFGEAHGGTLVIDEVGELPLALQSKLLRAVNDGEIQPVGAGKVERVDVRIISSTHRDLRAEITAGRFREDLYYRLAVVDLVVPPLRERLGDIALLAESFRRRFTLKFGVDVHFDPELMAALQAQPFPGNVRELENAVARLVVLSDGGMLGVEALDLSNVPVGTPAPVAGTLRMRVAAFERDLVEKAMAASGANQSEAARALGLPRGTLIEKLKRYGIS